MKSRALNIAAVLAAITLMNATAAGVSDDDRLILDGETTLRGFTFNTMREWAPGKYDAWDVDQLNAPYAYIDANSTLRNLSPWAVAGNVDPAQVVNADDNDGDDDILATMTIRGEATLDKPADQLRIRIGVVTEDANAQEALERNSQRMTDVIEALKKSGLTDKDYKTAQFSIQPRYSPRPRNADQNWRPKIVGYQVTNTLYVKTSKLESAGELIQAANEAGANTIDSISFALANPRAYRSEAIAAATANARNDAQTLAEAADLRLVRIVSITLDGAHAPPPIQVRRGMEMAGLAAADAMAPPIAGGDVTVRANVAIVYEIAPRN